MKFEKLNKTYSVSAMLKLIRQNIGDKLESFSKKIGVSNEFYSCFEREEISFDNFTDIQKKKAESLINTYFATFRLNRKDAFTMFEMTTGMNRRFFVEKFDISEKTFYNYLQGDNIQCAAEIDRFLLIE